MRFFLKFLIDLKSKDSPRQRALELVLGLQLAVILLVTTLLFSGLLKELVSSIYFVITNFIHSNEIISLLILMLVFYIKTAWDKLRNRPATSSPSSQLATAWVQSINNSDNSIIYLKDENMRLLACSNAFLSEFQLTREQVIGCTFNEFMATGAYEFEEVMDYSARSAAEYQVYNAQGSEIRSGVKLPLFMEISKYPLIDDSGVFHGLVTVRRDVSKYAKKLEMARIRVRNSKSIMDQLPIGIALCEAVYIKGVFDFKALDTNRAFRKLHENVTLSPYKTARETWPMMASNNAQMMIGLQEVVEKEIPFECNAWFPSIGKMVELVAIPLGRNQFVINVNDITDISQAEDHIIKLNARLQYALQGRGLSLEQLLEDTNVFIHSVVGQIQDPLRTLNKHIILEDRSTRDVAIESVRCIESRLQTLLKFASSGAMPYKLGLVNTKQVVLAIMNESTAMHPGIKCTVGDLPTITIAESAFRFVFKSLGIFFNEFMALTANAHIRIDMVDDFIDTIFHVTLSTPAPGFQVTGFVPGMDLESMEQYWPTLSLVRITMRHHGGILSLASCTACDISLTLTFGEPILKGLN